MTLRFFLHTIRSKTPLVLILLLFAGSSENVRPAAETILSKGQGAFQPVSTEPDNGNNTAGIEIAGNSVTVPWPVEPDEVREIFQEYDRSGSPGCAAGVSHRGELIFSEGYGYANLDYDIPITPQSRFMIASISKQFAAAAMLMMEQEGLLDLDEDITPWLPQLQRYGREITGRHLIHHMSGIRDIYDLLAIADIGLDNTTTGEEAADLIGRQRTLNFAPGDMYLYSNSAYFYISLLVRNRTGMSLREYSARHLLVPSGMEETHWHDDTGKIVPNRVISYRQTPEGPGRFYRDNMDRVGARGLFTTIEDFARWDRNFIENQTRLEDFSRVMTRPGRTSYGRPLNYAAGLRLSTWMTLRTVGHGGNYMGFRSHYVRFPQYDLSVMVFCNRNDINPQEHAFDVAALYLRSVVEERMADYTGAWESPSLGSRLEIEVRDGTLWLIRPDGEEERLEWGQNGVLAGEDWDLRLDRENDRLQVKAPRTSHIDFIRASS